MKKELVENLIKEVIEIDPSLRGKEGVLRAALEKFDEVKPKVSIDERFVSGLRSRLMFEKQPAVSPWKYQIFYGLPLALVAVLVVMFTLQNYRGGTEVAINTPVVDTKQPEAFGPLAIVTPQAKSPAGTSPKPKGVENPAGTGGSVPSSTPAPNTTVPPKVGIMMFGIAQPVAVPAKISFEGEPLVLSAKDGYVYKVVDLVTPLAGIDIYNEEGNVIATGTATSTDISYERSLYPLETDWQKILEQALAQAGEICNQRNCERVILKNPRLGLELFVQDNSKLLVPAIVFDLDILNSSTTTNIILPLIIRGDNN